MRIRMLTALVLFLAVLPFWRPAPAVAATGDLTGNLAASGGFSLVVWGGGSTVQLAGAASARGCTLTAAWVTAGGGFTGYVFGAPTLGNNAFAALFPSSIPANTAILAVCRGAQTVTAPAAPAANVDVQLSQLIFVGLNGERTSRGLPALTESSIL